jgi:1,4-alpha-glucan branching enzyme
LYTYQWTYPGKQLLFMGSEFAQESEWNSGTALPWDRSREALPEGVAALLRDLNHLQAVHPALSEWDCDARGFEWISGEDREQSVLTFLRRSENEMLAVILNFTPVPRYDYRIGVPAAGMYREVFNSDSPHLGGSGMLNREAISTETHAFHGRDNSLCVNLPPLGGVVLKYQS